MEWEEVKGGHGNIQCLHSLALIAINPRPRTSIYQAMPSLACAHSLMIVYIAN